MVIICLRVKYVYDTVWGLAYRLLSMSDGGMIYNPCNDYLGYHTLALDHLDDDVVIELTIYTGTEAMLLEDSIYGMFAFHHTKDAIFFLTREIYYSIREVKVSPKWIAVRAGHLNEFLEMDGQDINVKDIVEQNIVKGDRVIKSNTVLKKRDKEFFEDFDMNRFLKDAYGDSNGQG